MDEPTPPSSKPAAGLGVAVGLLLLPAVLFFACWYINRNSPLLFVFFFGAPVFCGLAAGGILGRRVRGSTAVRFFSGLLLVLASVVVSFLIILAGCSMMAPLRS